MTSYVTGFPAAAYSGTTAETLSAIELRVISNLIQQQSGPQQQDELKQLRNDQAFDLGITPPVIPGN